MGLPCSKGELDRLGARLVSSDELSTEDYDLWESVLVAYDEVRGAVQTRLTRMGLQVTGRVKTRNTLVDKLRREETIKLSRVQDVAGVRVVLDGGRWEQNLAVRRIRRTFGSSNVRVRDRRQDPSSGYRAVHLIVKQDGLPIEVQVRTTFQDFWAQAFERLGDQWGRPIRYGGEPDLPDTPIGESSDGPITRRDFVRMLHDVSDQIHAVEQAQLILRQQREDLDDFSGEPDEAYYIALRHDHEQSADRVREAVAALESLLITVLRFVSQGAGNR